MLIKQISVFIENRPGRLSDIISALAAGGIDIRALSLADTTNFGILRLVVNDPARAAELLRSQRFTVSVSEVLAVEIPDEPGGLASTLAILNGAGISVEYAYAIITRKAKGAYVILRVENNNIAVDTLRAGGVKLVGAEELYAL